MPEQKSRIPDEERMKADPEGYLKEHGIDFQIKQIYNFKKEYLGQALPFVPKDFLDPKYIRTVKLGYGIPYQNEDLGSYTYEKDVCVIEDAMKPYELKVFYSAFFHEIWHAIDKKVLDEMSEQEKKHFADAYKNILETEAFRSGDFGRYTDTRISVQMQGRNQFFAEFNKMFILEGDELRKFISMQPEKVKAAYQEFYNLFKDRIYKREYSEDDTRPLKEFCQAKKDEVIADVGMKIFADYKGGKLQDWQLGYFESRYGLDFFKWARERGLINTTPDKDSPSE